jgi:hypothetical protein
MATTTASLLVTCPECGREFSRAGIGVHQTRAHGVRLATDELARWDGQLLTLDTRHFLAPHTCGPCRVTVAIGFGSPPEWEHVTNVHQHLPMPNELLALIAAVHDAGAGSRRRERVQIVVTVDPL